MSDSIYAPNARRITPWSAPRVGAATLQTSATVVTSHDAQLLAILDAPLRNGEPATVGFARKERELCAAFETYPIFDQRALHARLSNPRPGDALADRFSRLTIERRTRLVHFLGDARRRAVLAAGKR
jgi:hypothetical protein